MQNKQFQQSILAVMYGMMAGDTACDDDRDSISNNHDG